LSVELNKNSSKFESNLVDCTYCSLSKIQANTHLNPKNDQRKRNWKEHVWRVTSGMMSSFQGNLRCCSKILIFSFWRCFVENGIFGGQFVSL